MAGRISKNGKKFGGRHSSYTKMAADLIDSLHNEEELKKISAGIIKTNLPNLKGHTRIKIIDEGSCVLVRVRGNISMQEVRLYGDSQVLRKLISDYAQTQGIQLDK